MKGNNGKGNIPERDLWETPQELWDKLNKQYNFFTILLPIGILKMGRGGLEPPKTLHRLIYSQEPLPLGDRPVMVRLYSGGRTSSTIFLVHYYKKS